MQVILPQEHFDASEISEQIQPERGGEKVEIEVEEIIRHKTFSSIVKLKEDEEKRRQRRERRKEKGMEAFDIICLVKNKSQFQDLSTLYTARPVEMICTIIQLLRL